MDPEDRREPDAPIAAGDSPPADGAGARGAPGDEAFSDGPALANRYEIRILADGRVVFGDLPQGLLEVARVVAGSEAESPLGPAAAPPRDAPPQPVAEGQREGAEASGVGAGETGRVAMESVVTESEQSNV